MPIRLNLLAEAQAEEELRRKDPVKRALWAAGYLICCVLVYYGILVAMTLAKHSNLKSIEGGLAAQETQYKKISDNEKKLSETHKRLDSLRFLAANRFLWGNVLNALQQSTLDVVQLTRFRAEQTHATTEETKPKTDENGRVTIGKPGFVTQRITLFFDAKDVSPTPGDQINKFKTSLAAAHFFGKASKETNAPTLTLKNLSAPVYDGESGKTVMLFSLECRFADKIIK
jgi:hypothetical protein